MNEKLKPLIGLAKSFENFINPEYDYFVINKITNEYGYHSWSGLVDLINRFGINNFIVFNSKDEVQLENEIHILKESGE